ncbi:MFS transporter [Reinekea sp.]|uniref:spinster family MFS transporter n=1 Tax=Reinekea sp. TaxID=1970455 RepID=UPI00257B171D|nr:MFS transporter [Reinekea sp.]
MSSPTEQALTSEADIAIREKLKSPRYRKYVLGMLVVVYAFNFLDRQIVTILAEPIKNDLGLNDTQIGLMTGLAFALFYTVLGIPLARLADRSNRVSIITAALVVWSGMTALCGMAQNFTQMLAARIGVGVGEAGCSPPAHSLIADYYPANQRASALSIYALGIPIGSILGLLAGGWIAEFYGWRMAFFVVGLPGIALAFAVKMTIREPIRGMSDPASSRATEQLPLIATMLHLLKNRTLMHIAMGGALTSFVGYGLGQWLPAYFIRIHEMGIAETATYFGLVLGVASAVGTFLGGTLADKLSKRDVRFYAWLPAVGVLVAFPFYVAAMMSDNPYIAIAILIVPSTLNSLWLGPSFGTIQNLAPTRMRAMASALMLFILNIIGLGLGPFLVGVLSDLLSGTFGIDSLRYAILIATVAYFWAGAHFVMAGKTIRQDLEAAQRAADAA